MKDKEKKEDKKTFWEKGQQVVGWLVVLSLLISPLSVKAGSTPLIIEEEREALKVRLKEGLHLEEDIVRITQIQLKERSSEIPDEGLRKRLEELLKSLESPEDLLLPSEQKNLIARLGEHKPVERDETHKAILRSHKAFGALSDRMTRLESLAKDLEGKCPFFVQPLRTLSQFYRNYRETFVNLSSLEGNDALSPRVKLSGTHLPPSLIAQDLAYRLISKTPLNIEAKQNEVGGHAVSSWKGVYFKVYDLDMGLCPGRELAMHHLYKLLVGEGVAPTTLLYIEDIPMLETKELDKTRQRIMQAHSEKKPIETLLIEAPHLDREIDVLQKKKTYPVQASYSIDGVGFHQFLENVAFANWLRENGENRQNPERYFLVQGSSPYTFKKHFLHPPTYVNDPGTLNKEKWRKFLNSFDPQEWTFEALDPETSAKMVLMSFITEPDDAKPDNFMVYKDNNTKKWRLISIDTDRALEEGMTKFTHGELCGEHRVDHKCIFYLLPSLMNHPPITDSLKTHFKNLRAPVVLAQWLFCLQDENEAYAKLQKESSLPEKIFHHMKLPISFERGKILSLLHHIEKLQKIFRDYDHHLTLDRVFELLHPVLHAFYQAMQKKYSDTTWNEIYFPQKTTTVEKILGEDALSKICDDGSSLKDILHNFNTPSQTVESIPEDLHKKNPPQSLDDTLKELIQVINARALEAKEEKERKPNSNPVPLNLHEMILEAGDISLFKRLMAFQGPQTVDPSLGRRFYQTYLKPSGQLVKDPDLQGEWKRLVAFNPKLQWYMALDHLFLPPEEIKTYQEGKNKEDKKEKNVFKITGATEGERYLPQEVWNKLFDNAGQFIKQNEDGAHAVGKATWQGYTLYFKLLPKLPGTEESVGRLTRQLIGFGAPHVELFRLNDLSILVSQEIKGLTLKKTLESHPERLNPKQLDPESLSSLFLMAMLTNPEDGRPDNYVVEQIQDHPPLYRIVGIDNDQAFAPAVAKEQKKEWGRAHHVVQVKSILYCMNQMKDPIQPHVREKFKKLDPRKELSTWLVEIDRVHQQQVSLFANEKDNNALLQKLFKENDSFIGIAFKKGDLHQIYDRFLRLQAALHDPTVMTHQDLLLRVEPRLGRRYGVLMNDPRCSKDIYERFKKIDGEFFSQAMGTLTSGKQTLEAQGIPEKEALEDIIKQVRHYTPKLALGELEKRAKDASKSEALAAIEDLGGQSENFQNEEFRKKIFRRLDFNHARRKDGTYGPIPLNGQQKILKDFLSPYDLHDLTLLNCQALTEYVLIQDLKIQDLTEVTLRGCGGVTTLMVIHLAQTCPGLSHLDLSHCPNLTWIGSRYLLTTPLPFPSLRVFMANKCEALKEVQLEGDKLDQLMIQDNKVLTMLILQSRSLKKIRMDRTTQLTDETLDRVGDTCLALESMSCQGCTQLKSHKLREDHPSLPQRDLSPKVLGKIEGAYKKGQKIIILDLRDREIKPKEIKALAKISTLTSLDLSSNKVRDVGARAIAENLTQLQKLNLESNNVGDAGARVIAEHLTQLQELDLSYNDVGVEGARAIAKHLAQLKTLDLKSNSMWSEGARAIAEHLTQLKELNLENNYVGDEGARAIAEHLTQLQTLNLYNNNVGDAGARILAQRMTQLQRLNLGWNDVGDAGARAIAEKLTQLTTLSLWGNDVGVGGARAIAANLTQLKELDLGRNNVGDAGARTIAEHLTQLQTLNLYNNNVGAETQQYVKSRLPHTDVTFGY